MLPTLVLGTRNRKKGLELAVLFEPLGLRLQTLADYPSAIEVVEDGDSFAANARLKATQQARHLGRWTLGEDSGLVVDALGGAPGVYSARYSGPDATDESNNRRLLEALAKTEESERSRDKVSRRARPDAKDANNGAERLSPTRAAHYVCHMTLADPRGAVRAESEDLCRGHIRRAPAGEAGFGYDPLFEIAEYHRTFGQLGDSVKSVLSHRSRAARQLVPQLAALLASGAWVESRG